DGTLWETLPRMARALFEEPLTRRKKGVFKGHIQFDIFQHIPCDAEFSMGDGGDAVELKQHLRSGSMYILDRGFINYDLYSKIMDAGSSFLVRLKENCAVEVTEERPIGAAEAEAGVQRDALVLMGTGRYRLERPLRLIHAKTTLPPPHNLHPVRKR